MPVLEFVVSLKAPPARVFAALTGARHLEGWFCDEAVVEPGVNGRIVMRWTGPRSSPQAYEAFWQEWDPPRACAFTGGHSGYPDGHAGRIEYEVTDDAGDARLRVRHAMPDQPEYEPIADRYRAAWPKALERLRGYLAPVR